MANKVFGATVKNRKDGGKDAGETSGLLKLKSHRAGEPHLFRIYRFAKCRVGEAL